MPSRKSAKPSHREAMSVADMLATQRPSARGVHADQTPKPAEAAGPATIQGTPPDTSNTTMLQSITEVKGFLAAEIARTAAEVKSEIAAIGTRTTIVEQCVAHVVTAQNGITNLTNTLQHRITDLEIEIEDMSN
ncbi:Hypothetical predicted protein [Pelobates cultripes]|uniref:Uncharacterized protein n=1 Tax=Pelobates cultripes TaxID=61616 RepID=A0AAD1VZH5_PELCU|nr:Hypothetical predicted protein [Pelobates cultripes]